MRDRALRRCHVDGDQFRRRLSFELGPGLFLRASSQSALEPQFTLCSPASARRFVIRLPPADPLSLVDMVEIPTTFCAPSAFTETTSIKRKPAANLWHAVNHAKRIGRPLNLHVTLTLSETACPERLGSRRFRKLLEHCFARWLRGLPSSKRGHAEPPYYVWVAECPNAHLHVHWLVHVRLSLWSEFRTLLPTWVERSVGEIFSQSALHIQVAPNPQGLRKYLLKGADPAYAIFCGIRHQPQGTVCGKRSGVSRSLQRTARKRAGYKPGARSLRA